LGVRFTPGTYPETRIRGHDFFALPRRYRAKVRVIPSCTNSMESPPGEHGDREDGSQTARLLRAYHQRGDSGARQQLIELYLPLVESFARRHVRPGCDYDDLYQVGCVGLINAIDRFELVRGDELVAFAAPTIAGEMRRYLRDRSGSVRLPRRVLDLRGPAREAQVELSATLGHTATAAEVAHRLGEDEEEVALALDANRAASPLQLEPELDGGADGLDAAEDRLFLSGALRELGERERRILYLRYVQDLEPDDIARELAISRRQLSRNTQAALAKLRLGLERSGPPPQEPARSKPAPRARPDERSGRLLVRVPQSLHAELVRAAAREEKSLNRFVVTALTMRTVRLRPAHTRLGAAATTNLAVLAVATALALVVVLLAAGRVV
jgi:RNA polymerase sigma-B factor